MKKNRFFWIGVLLCLLIIVLYSLSVGKYADFVPINGSFQNYNPVRRLLSGQIPYKDFQDYLGLGHLFTGTIATFIFGGLFKSSLAAFSFLSLAGFAGIAFVTGKIILKNKDAAIGVTNIVMILLILQPVVFSNSLVLMNEINEAMYVALYTGNSARFVRGMILPVSILLLWIGKKICGHHVRLRKDWVYAVLAGAAGGFSFCWSNDFGICCWLSLFAVTFIFTLSIHKKFVTAVKLSAIELGASIVSVFVFAEIFTLGHFTQWVSATFGTGGYQQWYYNSAKSYYLWDMDTAFPVLLQIGLCILYIIRTFISKDQEQRVKNALMSYENMVCVFAVQEYRLLSGENSREIAYTVLFFNILFEIIRFVIHKKDRDTTRKIIFAVSVVTCLAWCVSSVKDQVVDNFSENKGVFVEKMGGFMTSLGEDLIETDAFLDGDSFFSTYASAQEVVSDTWQPSGTDYIIHVLGDRQRENYLDAFSNKDFRYTATIKESYTDWEYWIKRANWFFYRSLYREWHPVFANSYETYWERNTAEEEHIISDGFHISYTAIDDSTGKICVQCNQNINGTADVYIDYKVHGKGGISSIFNLHRLLKVSNTGTTFASSSPWFFESNYLRAESAEYIPVPVVNGYGEVTLTADPERSASLELRGYSCDVIYTVTSDYVEIEEIKETESGSVITIPDYGNNLNSINSAVSIEYDFQKAGISGAEQKDHLIFLTLDKQIHPGKSKFIKIVQ